MENAHRNSNGIFLWAKLFTKYLRSPALTPRDRLNFVEAALAFDGLDSLFSHILRRLSKRSQPENGITAKLFRWLATSLYPLIAEEMETALAITPGEQTMDVDHLLNFPAIVPQITGSLVELDLAGRLAFIHLSVRDFLASVRSDQFPDFALPSFTERNLELALVCLSYLAHDIPRQPIFKIVPRGLLQPWNDNISSLPDSEGVLPTFHGGEMRMSKLRRKRGIANGLSSSLTGDAREISRRNVAASSALV
jgi:hypothetical protein